MRAGRMGRLSRRGTVLPVSVMPSVGAGVGFRGFLQNHYSHDFLGIHGKIVLAETGLAEFEKMETGIWQFFL